MIDGSYNYKPLDPFSFASGYDVYQSLLPGSTLGKTDVSSKSCFNTILSAPIEGVVFGAKFIGEALFALVSKVFQAVSNFFHFIGKVLEPITFKFKSDITSGVGKSDIETALKAGVWKAASQDFHDNINERNPIEQFKGEVDRNDIYLDIHKLQNDDNLEEILKAEFPNEIQRNNFITLAQVNSIADFSGVLNTMEDSHLKSALKEKLSVSGFSIFTNDVSARQKIEIKRNPDSISLVFTVPLKAIDPERNDQKYVALYRTITISNSDLEKDWKAEKGSISSLQVADRYISAKDSFQEVLDEIETFNTQLI